MNRKTVRLGAAVVFLLTGQIIAVAQIQDVINQALHLLLDAKVVGITATAYLLAGLIGTLYLVMHNVMVKIGEQRLLLWSLLLRAVTLVGYPFAMGNPALLTVVRMIDGLLYVLITNSVFLVTRNSVPEKHRPRVSAIAGACTFLGSGLAMAAGVNLAKTSLLWPTVILLGVLSTLLISAGLLIHPDKLLKLHIPRKIMSGFVEKVLLANKQAWLLALPGLGVTVSYSAFLTWFTNTWKESPELVLFAATLANCIVAVTFMHKFAAHPRGYFPLMLASNVAMLLSLLLIWQGSSLWVMLFAGVLMGITVSGNNLAITEAIAQRTSKLEQGTAFSAFRLVIMLGGIVSMAYSSVMWELVGRTMWVTVTPFLVLSLVGLILLRNVRSQSNSSNIYISYALSVYRADAATGRMSRSRYGQTLYREHLKSIENVQAGVLRDHWLKQEKNDVQRDYSKQKIKNAHQTLVMLEVLKRNHASQIPSLDHLIKQAEARLLCAMKDADEKTLKDYCWATSCTVPFVKENLSVIHMDAVNRAKWLSKSVTCSDLDALLDSIKVLAVVDLPDDSYTERELQPA